MEKTGTQNSIFVKIKRKTSKNKLCWEKSKRIFNCVPKNCRKDAILYVICMMLHALYWAILHVGGDGAYIISSALYVFFSFSSYFSYIFDLKSNKSAAIVIILSLNDDIKRKYSDTPDRTPLCTYKIQYINISANGKHKIRKSCLFWLVCSNQKRFSITYAQCLFSMVCEHAVLLTALIWPIFSSQCFQTKQKNFLQLLFLLSLCLDNQ